MPRYALKLAYDGTAYRGWWRQPEGTGVADRLDAACRGIDEGGGAVGASRTDAGVHAHGQVAHLDCARERDPAHLPNRLNRHLPDDIVCLAAVRMPEDWHAVHAAVTKTYRYRLRIATLGDPFAARYVWHRPGLDPVHLQTTGDVLTGEHDFSAFVRRGDHRQDGRCQLEGITWDDNGDELLCTITGSRFILHLVRSLVGVMVARATHQISPDAVTAALAGEVNEATRHQAPAQGLCLWAVDYAPAIAWTRGSCSSDAACRC